MKTITFLFLSILSATTLSAALATAQQEQSSILRLGMVAPLSGDFAPYGEHIKRGIEVATDDLKAEGINIHVSYEDGCLPTEVRSSLSKLVNIDRIEGLVGSYCVIGMVAAESILEAARVVSFQTSGGTKEITDAGEYLFTTAGRTTEEAYKLAEHAFQRLGLKKVAVLYLTTQWGEEFQRAFSKRFSELGGTITGSETNPIGVNDFRTELTKLRRYNPDGLVVVHLAQTLGIAIKQAREMGYSKQLLATTDAEEQSVLDVAGDRAEGLQFFAPEPKTDTARMVGFADKFRKKFNRDPHPLARHSYDATLLTAQALTQCQRDKACAKDRIYQLKNYSGASGVFSIESDGGAKREFVLKIVKNQRVIKSTE